MKSYRVLKPNGVIRLTTPDVVECCRLFLGLREDVKLAQLREVWLDGDFSEERWINAQFLDYGHRHLYSFAGMRELLIHAGFREPKRCLPHETASPYPELAGLENRYGKDAPPWIWCRTLIIEAVK